MQPKRAFYINLDRRTDRRAEFEEEARKMGLEVERFEAISHAVGGIGCARSHLEVIRLAKARGYPSVLVFEDDFMLVVSGKAFLEILDKVPNDYDVAMFGYNMRKTEPYNETFGRILEAQTTSCFLVNSKYYDTLISNFSEGVALFEQSPHCHWLYIIDQYWKPLQPNGRWYYSLQRIGRQRPGYSDLTNTFVEYDC